MVSYKDRSAMIVDPTNVLGIRVRCGGEMEFKKQVLGCEVSFTPIINNKLGHVLFDLAVSY